MRQKKVDSTTSIDRHNAATVRLQELEASLAAGNAGQRAVFASVSEPATTKINEVTQLLAHLSSAGAGAIDTSDVAKLAIHLNQVLNPLERETEPASRFRHQPRRSRPKVL